LRRPEAVRACNQFGRLGFAKVIVQPASRVRLAKEGNPAEKGQSSNKDKNTDGFSQGACSSTDGASDTIRTCDRCLSGLAPRPTGLCRDIADARPIG
jgi:hypothetical protein